MMQNELCRIGALIFDLKKGVELEPHEKDFGFLEEEFRRIIMDLGFVWYRKSLAWGYQLEFHKLEAIRLLEMVRQLNGLQSELAEINQQDDHLVDAYTSLVMYLTELVERIETMIGTADIAAKPCNLN